MVGNVKDLHNKGGWADPWEINVIQTQYVNPGPGSEYSRVDVVLSHPETYRYDGSGAPPKIGESKEWEVLIFAMKYEGDHWVIRGGETQ